MNIKKKAVENIIQHLTNERYSVCAQIRSNLRKFKNLEIEQRVLKRQRAKYDVLINELRCEN